MISSPLAGTNVGDVVQTCAVAEPEESEQARGTATLCAVALVIAEAEENAARFGLAGLPEVVTVPLPEGVAHVPSPRQNVVPLAEVPEFKLPTGKFPETSAVKETALLVTVCVDPAK